MGPCDVCGQETDTGNARVVVFTTGGTAPRHNDCIVVHKHRSCGGGIAEARFGSRDLICLACNVAVEEKDIIEAKYIKGVLITEVHQ